MRYIMNHLGEAVLSAIAVGCLIFFLFGTAENGFLYRMESGVGEEQYSYSKNAAYDVFRAVAASSKPDIVYLPYTQNGVRRSLQAGTSYNLNTLFEAKDEDDTPLDVCVERIRDVSTDSEIQVSDTTAFTFPQAGIYEVRLTAINGSKVKAARTIRIPVGGK